MITTTPTTEKKPKPKPKPAPVPFNMGVEMKQFGKTPLAYDEDALATDIVKKVAAKMGIDQSLLFTSAWQEGMNKAALSPDLVSLGYIEANVPGEYPVDGFANYGVDTFGDRYEQLKKYLPEGFDKEVFFYKTLNEKDEPITTAAFKTNEDALVAKAAFMKYEADNVNAYAKKKGIELDDEAKKYFMLAAYNGGGGNAIKIMDEYIKAKDKKKFIAKGETSLTGVHKNIKIRLDNIPIADELLK